MNTKIQELTDLIYNEGVVKGQQEADKVISDAKSQAEKILADARKEAEAIITRAKKESSDNAENVRKELKLYSQQSLGALKSEIASVITDKIVSDSVKSFVSDKDTFNYFILSVASQWAKNEDIVISTADSENLISYFNSKAKDLLDKGVKINKVNGKAMSFTIQPADGSYKVNFGAEEFENYFKSLLRPGLVDLLF